MMCMGKVCVPILAPRGGVFSGTLASVLFDSKKAIQVLFGGTSPPPLSVHMLLVWASAQISQCSSSAWLWSLVKRGTYDLGQLNVGQSLGFFFPRF